jgi:SAM-dependent methyltransferase
MDDDFYLRFENRFRGSRSDIKERVKVYLPVIAPLKAIYPERFVVDVGCGRGEWLELLAENGWKVQGVDINQSMVEQCQALGLSALQGDAIGYLRTLESDSVAIVSGFHIAEHLPFDLLLDLFKEARRVLLPGGMLILETPNPENILVGSCTFYMDPTHGNPLPPSLLQFMAEDACFANAVIMRLNGPAIPEDGAPIRQQVSWALTAHPDYGLVAQKEPDGCVAGLFDYIEKLKAENIDSLTNLMNILESFETELQQAKTELYCLTHSRSWKITKPLRIAGYFARCLRRWLRQFGPRWR